MNAEPQIRLALPISVVEHLLRTLDEQPRRIANPIFNLIQGQAMAQMQQTGEPQTSNEVKVVEGKAA
jgi:hypothetical protein